MTGRAASMPLPPHLRVYMYKAFGLIYGINFDEIKVDDLNKFRTFNQFFTREIKKESRPIDEPQDPQILSSPCDGKVLSFGTVNADTFTMECIKGNAYRVDEFLFGYKSKAEEGKQTPIQKIITSAKDRGQKIMFMVVYLAPGDYHRFHSPASFTANYRRHLPGFLEPVDPRYLKKHRDVIKSNERVNLFGDWTYGFFSISFVGATNVGSIKIHFDDSLKTNLSSPQVPYINDRNYATLNSADNAFHGYPIRQFVSRDDTPIMFEEETLDIDSMLQEFDIKDILDIKKSTK
jgi:phosphatidylserine decarboxylase